MRLGDDPWYRAKVLEVLRTHLNFHRIMLRVDVKYWAKYNFPTLVRYM